jgi:hypothetical protein
MRSCGSSGVDEAGTGDGEGYGGWKLGDGIRGLALAATCALESS